MSLQSTPTRRRLHSLASFASPLPLGLYVRAKSIEPLLTSEFSPRRALYMAHPWLLWTNVVSDILVGLSYVLFFYGLCWIISKLSTVPELKSHIWVLSAFRIFLLASGASVFIRILTLWLPMYQFSIVLKIICAAAATPTALIFAYQARSIASSVHLFFDLLTTEKSQAETLRKSQEFLDRTGRIAGIGGWEVDLSNDHVIWSAETYRIHGVPLDYQPTLQAGISMYTPEARPTIIAAVLTASLGGPGWDLELPVVRKDGQTIMVRCVGEVQFRDGKPNRLLGAFQDITAAVAARDELRLANERATLATDSGEIGIWDFDVATQTLVCNSWMFRLHGKDSNVPPKAGDLWRDHVHPDDRAVVDQALQDALDGVEDFDSQFRIVWADGSVHTIRGTAGVTRDANGRPLRMVGANWDVTEARRLSAEHAEQHEMLSLTLRSIADGVITTDLNRNVSWMNPVAERMTGWSSLEACGEPLSIVFTTLNAETRQPADNPLAHHAAQGNVVGVARQTLLISRSGSEFGIENQAAPIRNSNGELLGNILVFRDVTEQRRLAAETEHVTRLQLELKTKDEFLSHVSHELRSPLTSIYSFTSIIADDLAGTTTAEQKEYLQIVLKNVVQLQSMIEDLLTVTQTREGKLSIELQSVSPADAIGDAIHTLRSAALTKQIALTGSDTFDEPPACADPTRLRQILIILLDNAIKFTPTNGRVSATVSQTHLNRLLFQVSDTGWGIPEEKRTLIFENLYQITGPSAPDTSQQGRIGLGLGLHIARNLVTRQGGQIWVTESPEGGSTFNFTLPIFSESYLANAEDMDHPRRRKTDKAIELSNAA